MERGVVLDLSVLASYFDSPVHGTLQWSPGEEVVPFHWNGRELLVVVDELGDLSSPATLRIGGCGWTLLLEGTLEVVDPVARPTVLLFANLRVDGFEPMDPGRVAAPENESVYRFVAARFEVVSERQTGLSTAR